MANGGDKQGGQPEAPGDAAAGNDGRPGGDSLQDASEEMVRFMEQDDEPGHAGRGDGG